MEQVRRRFAEYRQSHAVRARWPEELGAQAAKLARREGIEATAQALDVDRPSRKKWTERFEPCTKRRVRGQPAAPALVELLTALASQAACRVEVASAWGAKLRLEFASLAPDPWAEMIRAFAAGGTCCRSRRRCGFWWRGKRSIFAKASTRWPKCAAPS